MDGMGERIRARTRKLGLSDVDVARLVGVSQQRFSGYVSDKHEPDLATLVRICTVLGLSSDELLMPEARTGSASGNLERSRAGLAALDCKGLAAVGLMIDALIASKGLRKRDSSV